MYRAAIGNYRRSEVNMCKTIKYIIEKLNRQLHSVLSEFSQC